MWKSTPPQVDVEENPPEVVVEEDPPEVDTEEDPLPPEVVMEEGSWEVLLGKRMVCLRKNASLLPPTYVVCEKVMFSLMLFW